MSNLLLMVFFWNLEEIMKLFGNMYIDNNTINIGNYSVNELAKKYKTPLYIIDEEGLIKNIEKYKNNFKSDKFETEVIYASKALLNTYMAKIIKDNNLCKIGRASCRENIYI